MRNDLKFKPVLLASLGLVAVLNLIAFARGYNQSARAVFEVPQAVKQADGAAAGTPAAKAPAQTPLVMPADATNQDTSPGSPAARLAAAGLDPSFASHYVAVQAQTGVPWQLLAAVHKVETGQSGDTTRTSYAGATGPMQFMPATFNHYALDGDGDGTRRISDLDDAMLTAGRYLAAGGADRGNYNRALYNYNHSTTYVSKVLTIARKLGL